MATSKLRRCGVRIGLVSDIHADLPALERALGILERAGVDRVVCLGDVVEKGPQPDAVVERLDRLCIPTVAGNHDRNAVRHAELEGRDAGMSAATLAWLAALPETREYLWAGKHVSLAHASLGAGDARVLPGEVPKRMRRALRQRDRDVVVLGHSHIPMWFAWSGCWLGNPGSISKGRCRLGATCGVLVLPALELELYSMGTGRRVALKPS